MDSMGGFLTFGLLGNPLFTFLSSNFFLYIEDITPTPTPTPTLVPPNPNVGGGGGRYPDALPQERIVKITIVHNGKHKTSIHKVNDKTLRISINILKALVSIKEKTYSFAVKIRQASYNIKVKFNGN